MVKAENISNTPLKVEHIGTENLPILRGLRANRDAFDVFVNQRIPINVEYADAIQEGVQT